MKTLLPLLSAFLLAVFLTISSFAQVHWNTAPETGFVFQISNYEAQKLLTKSSPDTIVNAMLHTLVDTFDVDKGWVDRPDKGHFILARIIKNKLHCEYTSVFPYQVLLLKAYDALSLQVLDFDGNVREDAKVKFKARRIRFDKDSKTYRIENQWFHAKSKIATVELDGFRSVFNIRKHEVPFWDNDYDYAGDGPDFYSYMITDKNKYKPLEKVRFKSYALSGSRLALRRDLEVWLSKPGGTVRVGKVSPHRPGSYTGEVHLHDSLQLTLDKHYTLELRDRVGRVVATCVFRYEDYELHGNKLEASLESQRHYHPASNYVTLAALSDNGLRLKDAKAVVTVLTEDIRETFQPLVILRDTLFRQEVLLHSDKDTRVEISPSLFQKTNTTYVVHIAVVNSQGERMEQALRSSYCFSQYEVTRIYSGDSVIFRVLDNGREANGLKGRIIRDGVGVDAVFPLKDKINPATSTIEISTDTVSRIFRMADFLPLMKIQGGIERDSFKVSLHNPHQMEVSWYVYQGKDLLEKGSGKEMLHESLIEDRTRNYYVELLYSFGGKDHVATQAFEFNARHLDISLNIPERVYPGQTVNALIEVKDDRGNPVSGVDLTALATTAKLDYMLPDLPYYGEQSKARPEGATFSKTSLNKRSAILPLDYERWARLARLDTMKYYQFTYPGKRTFHHETAISDSTQFAAFVMQNGEAKRVYVIEVDRVPVYYSWTNQPQGYSFYVSPCTKKQITLRLFDRVLMLDSIAFERGRKTLLSIDLDHLPKDVTSINIPYEVIVKDRRRFIQWVFSPVEKSRHMKYLAAFYESEYPSYLEAENQFVPISRGRNNFNRLIVGPVWPGMVTFHEKGRRKTTYKHTGGYSYSFEDNIVYKLEPPKLIPDQLYNGSFSPAERMGDLAINKTLLFQQETSTHDPWHPTEIGLADHNCRLKVLLPKEEAMSGVATLLFRDPSSGKVLSPCRSFGGKSDYYTIPRGTYDVLVLYNNGTYLVMSDIRFRSHTSVVVDLKQQPLHAADSASAAWRSSMERECFPEVSRITRTLNLVQYQHQTGNVQGTILDDTNMPLPGATVVVKGTMIGAVTDVNGRFSIYVPEDYVTLVTTFIGYQSQEVAVRPGAEVVITMVPDVMALQEVIVVGYGVSTRREMTGSVSNALQGRVAGVVVNQKNESETADDNDGDRERREAEQKLYRELQTIKTLRSRFSDVGFWEPRLFTDRRGQSMFTVTFPDDITRWEAVVYGMNRRLQTGTVRKSIKSYKPIMSELHVPQFLVVGDSCNLLGKVLNYSGDSTIRGKTKWTAITTLEQDVSVDSYHTEKYGITVKSQDSLRVSYSFRRDDGYLDGEERKVPVIEKGIIRADGSLSLLQNGEQRSVKATEGSAFVEIADNPLHLYAHNIRYLLNYRYDCNEQLASKLIGLLNYKLLMAYEGKSFRHDRDVNKIIQRLLKSQNEEFLWSWWGVSANTSHWMSAHILRALKAAKEAGYGVDLDIENLARKATYKYDFLDDLQLSDLHVFHAMAMWDADIDYRRYIRMLDRAIQREDSVYGTYQWGRQQHYSLLNEKLLLMEVKQLKNLGFDRDSLLRYQKKTILNDVYFSDGRPSRHWYTQDLTSNVVAYRIISRDSTLSSLKGSLQMYFLSERRKGEWNTYQASNIVMTILPDLLATGSSKKAPATIDVSGKVNERVTAFPYRIELTKGQELNVRKETGAPLYFMEYREERVTHAASSTDGFTIATELQKKELKAGQPVILKATLNVKQDARLEHVMIELPIPAGCSYADRDQSRSHIETHREYFKDRTIIFCENMTPGTYVFQVELLPRFTGRYSVNPAQVSLMYFPVVNANTEMKTTVIRD